MELITLLINTINTIGIEQFTSWWIYSSIIIFFVLGILLFKPMFQLNHELSTYNKTLKKLDKHSEENFSRLQETFQNSKTSIKNCWTQYEHAVKYSRISLDRLPDPAPYFNYSQLIERYCQRRLAEVIPGIFTSFGILGTFIGLAVGLSDINISNIDQLRHGIGGLLGGINIAFYTSVVGILSSIIWLILDRNVLKLIISKAYQFNEHISGLLPVAYENEMIQELIKTQKDQLESIKGFVTDSLIPEIVNGFREAIKDSLAPQIAKTNEIVEQLAQSATDRQVEGIEKMVDMFINSLNSTFQDQFVHLTETITDMINWQKQVKGELEELVMVIKDGAEVQSRILESSANILGNVDKYAKDFEAFHEKIEQSVFFLENITTELSSISKETNQRLTEIFAKEEKIADTQQALIKKLDSQLESINTLWSSTKDNFTSLNNNLTNATKEFNTQMHEGIQNTFYQFDNNLAEATKLLAGVVAEMNEVVEELPERIRNFQDELKKFKAPTSNGQSFGG
ncbi:MAG: anti-phage defense ZorAB system ZorA [Clostridia bacterium]|nr:anti-phage defense ZorAB system ZorA [Clostridia bacterium]